jgi:restriction endonuclease S subunit
MAEKTLEDVCNILSRSNRNTKYGNKEGKYPFFKSSMIVDSYVDSSDYEGQSIIIGDTGNPNIHYSYEFSASNNCYILQNKNKSILNLKYAYYYLYNRMDIMKNLYKGNDGNEGCDIIKHISKASIKGIKIPIPSLEKQNEIVEYCENCERNIMQLEKEIENIKKHVQEYIVDIPINK